jgi:hypothetical protein
MGVVGYDKVATKVIEGKSKCIYKKPKGTKEYVMGFGKIRTVESYVKLCRKKAAKSKMAAKPKMAKPKMAKKMRSKSAKRYGGFLEQFFAEHTETEGFGAPGALSKDKEKYPSPPVAEKYTTKENMVDPEKMVTTLADGMMGAVRGGSSCYKGGQQQQKQQQQQQQKYGGQEQAGGKRRKKHTSNKSVLKMMMAAFKNKSAKKQKGKRRRGGGEDDDE